jgi:NitT/TauT family transport system permease protein
MPALGPALRPNQWVSRRTYLSLSLGWAAVVVLLWFLGPAWVPTPGRVWAALRELIATQGLLGELGTSLTLFAESLVLASLLSMGLAYLSVVPALRPPVRALTRARFLSLVGLTFVFTMMVSGGHALKVALLVFGISAFLLTSMVDVVEAVPTEKLDHARTLRMGEWRVVWEVVVLGQMGPALDAVRQNAAIGWMMLTMVEGISRSEGGIGALLMDQNKHFNLAAIFAVQIVFLVAGFFQDAFLAWLKHTLVPHAALTVSRGGAR